MRKLRSVLVLLAVVGLSLSFAIPANDVPETAYDESEPLPYVSTSLFSIPVPNAVVPAPAGRPLVAVFCPGSLRRLGSQRLDHRTDSPYPTSDSLTILNHTLRC
jgi:hypothetical protein